MSQRDHQAAGTGEQSDASDYLSGLDVRSRTVAQRVGEELRKSIIRGQLPGGAFMTETRLAEQLSVSRTPLREAIQMLEVEGWVQRRRGGGIEVTTPTIENTFHQCEVRAALEGLIAREIAPSLEDTDLRQIGSWTEKLVEAAEDDDPDRVAQFGRRVHELLHTRSRNTVAAQMLNLLRQRIERARNQVIILPGRSSEAASEHKALYNALLARDAVRAETAMTHHVLSGGAFLLKHLGGETEAAKLEARLEELKYREEWSKNARPKELQ